ncbi:MAG: hypothetical protein ACTHQ3_08315 [Motilibacteraceae bacterium]
MSHAALCAEIEHHERARAGMAAWRDTTVDVLTTLRADQVLTVVDSHPLPGELSGR